MEQEIRPFPLIEDLEVIDKKINDYRIFEVSESYFRKNFLKFREIQEELSSTPISERLKVLDRKSVV